MNRRPFDYAWISFFFLGIHGVTLMMFYTKILFLGVSSCSVLSFQQILIVGSCRVWLWTKFTAPSFLVYGYFYFFSFPRRESACVHCALSWWFVKRFAFNYSLVPLERIQEINHSIRFPWMICIHSAHRQTNEAKPPSLTLNLHWDAARKPTKSSVRSLQFPIHQTALVSNAEFVSE